MNHAPRISIPYSDLSNVIVEWSQLCETMAVYEHDADEKVKTTHCHVLMLNCSVGDEALKRRFHKLVKTKLTRNALWEWEHKDTPQSSYNLDFVRYMSKGVLAPKFVKNISPATVEEFRQKWVVESPKTSVASNSNSKTKDDLYCIIEEIKEELSKIEKPIQVTPWSSRGEVEFEQIVEVSIKVLKKHRKRWNSYDLERYVMPIAMDYPELYSNFVKKIKQKFFSS